VNYSSWTTLYKGDAAAAVVKSCCRKVAADMTHISLS